MSFSYSASSSPPSLLRSTAWRARSPGRRGSRGRDRSLRQLLDDDVPEINADVVALEPDVPLAPLEPGVLLELLLVIVEVRVHQFLPVQLHHHLAALADDPDGVPLPDRLVRLELRRLHVVDRPGVLVVGQL